ncbi:TIM barrel protein [Ekhidna sp.]|uniref:sugar phosphate isomerase/epimerase family protein n=1 Tax=Ekhidna sp. TaxID=2608089 RepID=UPI003299D4AB
MNIFISSVAFKNLTIPEIEEIAIQHQFSIEFSANFNPDQDLRNQFMTLTIDRLPHNYFPPPKDPFVLNLASQDREILKRSRNHCMKGIELASMCRMKYFSAHAGFCLDPSPHMLGKQLEQPSHIERDMFSKTFLDSCEMLSEVAKNAGVKFCFENNVLMQINRREDGINPLLCVDPEEIIQVLDLVNNDSLGFLLDTAHLKVSANSLGFDKDLAVGQLNDRIAYIHHSDNDGMEDTNEKLTANYWFLKHLKSFKNVPHVVEVKSQSIDDLKKQISLLRSSAEVI